LASAKGRCDARRQLRMMLDGVSLFFFFSLVPPNSPSGQHTTVLIWCLSRLCMGRIQHTQAITLWGRPPMILRMARHQLSCKQRKYTALLNYHLAFFLEDPTPGQKKHTTLSVELAVVGRNKAFIANNKMVSMRRNSYFPIFRSGPSGYERCMAYYPRTTFLHPRIYYFPLSRRRPRPYPGASLHFAFQTISDN